MQKLNGTLTKIIGGLLTAVIILLLTMALNSSSRANIVNGTQAISIAEIETEARNVKENTEKAVSRIEGKLIALTTEIRELLIFVYSTEGE